MFRPIRTAILLLVAFAAGQLVAQSKMRTACADLSGDWDNGLCIGGRHE